MLLCNIRGFTTNHTAGFWWLGWFGSYRLSRHSPNAEAVQRQGEQVARTPKQTKYPLPWSRNKNVRKRPPPCWIGTPLMCSQQQVPQQRQQASIANDVPSSEG